MLVGAGCASKPAQPAQSIQQQPAVQTQAATPTPGEQTAPAQPKTGLANPAAVKCAQDGLKYRMGENAQGQYGVCIFDDNSECEEWSYFRGTCKKADCQKWETCSLNTPAK